METRKCPLCGAPLDWKERMRAPWERYAAREGWERREWTTMGAGTVTEAVREGASYEKRRPVRAATVPADVTVPALQSVFSGVATGILAGAGAAVAQAEGAWLWGLMGGAVGMGVTWLVVLREHRQGLWEVERLVGRDLDGDGVVGDPAAKREPMSVELVERDRAGRLRRLRFVKWSGVTDEELLGLAKAVVVDEVPFSRRELAEVLSPDKYRVVSRAMVRGGLLRYRNGKNDRNGVELTASGRAVMRKYVVVGGGGR